MELNQLEQLRQQQEAYLKTFPNVIGTDIGEKISKGRPTGRKAIRVLVTRKVPIEKLAAHNIIPPAIASAETDVVEVDEVWAASYDHTLSYKPAPGGVSVGHPLTLGGTLGLPQAIYNGDTNHIVSNAHVIFPTWLGAKVGDPIHQPGLADSSNPRNIGKTVKAVPIIFDSVTPNLADVALASVNEGEVSPAILEVPVWGSTAIPEIGMKIKKSGRTSKLTEGVIEGIHASLLVRYDEERTALFTDQITMKLPYIPGDSGSAILTEDGKVIGIGFATNYVDYGWACPIQTVMQLLGIGIPEKVDAPYLPPLPEEVTFRIRATYLPKKATQWAAIWYPENAYYTPYLKRRARYTFARVPNGGYLYADAYDNEGNSLTSLESWGKYMLEPRIYRLNFRKRILQ